MRAPREIAPVDVAIIDCYFVAYRAFSVTPLTLKSRAGVPTNAIHGLAGGMNRLIRELKPKVILIATEGGPSHRDALYDRYKEGRRLPDLFAQQLPYIYTMCRLHGWPVIKQDGREADDVIGSLCDYTQAHQKRTVVFSTDKDVHALVDERTFVYGTAGKSAFIHDEHDLKAKWGVPPNRIPEVLALEGDQTDRIPGVQGIGRKTAVRLVQQFGTVENLLAQLDQVLDRIRTCITDELANLQLSRKLIALCKDLTIDPAWFQPPIEDRKGLHDFYLSLDMKKHAAAYSDSPQGSAPQLPLFRNDSLAA